MKITYYLLFLIAVAANWQMQNGKLIIKQEFLSIIKEKAV